MDAQPSYDNYISIGKPRFGVGIVTLLVEGSFSIGVERTPPRITTREAWLLVHYLQSTNVFLMG